MGCQPENDTWGIEWQFANAGNLAVQKCSGGSEAAGTFCNVMQNTNTIYTAI